MKIKYDIGIRRKTSDAFVVDILGEINEYGGTKMKVALCSTMKNRQKDMLNKIEIYKQTKRKHVELTCDVYFSGKELVKAYQLGQRYDFIIQSIGIEECEIEIIEEIRKIQQEIMVVFVASNSKFAVDAYKVHPIDYMMEPISEKRFMQTMDLTMRLCKLINKEKQYIFKSRGIVKSIRYIDIQSIACQGRDTIIKSGEEIIVNHKSLKEIENKFRENGFIKINRSEMVNIEYIKKIDGNKVLLNNKEILYISRGMMKCVRNEISAAEI